MTQGKGHMNTSICRKQRVERNSHRCMLWKQFKTMDYQLYVLAIPAIVYMIIFHYMPLYGVQIAFKDLILRKGINDSPWAGMKHFKRFFEAYNFKLLISNTLILSVYQLLMSFPFPIILALMLNQVRQKRFKATVQTLTYIPHFISLVVLVGMVQIILSPRTGFVNHIIQFFGGETILFMGEPRYYKHIYVWSGIWQSTGWNSIIYVAALSSVNPELYEAAKVDGASQMQIMRHVDLPGILPTIITMFLLGIGQMMNLGFQKALLLQNDLTALSQEIIQTYTYKIGLVDNQYSYAAAIGLFNSAINVVLLLTFNWISKKTTKESLW